MVVIWVGFGWGEPEGGLFVGVLRKRCRKEIVPLDQLLKTLYKAYITLLRIKTYRSVAFNICV